MMRIDYNLYCRILDLLFFVELSLDDIAILCRCDVAVVSYVDSAEFGNF